MASYRARGGGWMGRVLLFTAGWMLVFGLVAMAFSQRVAEQVESGPRSGAALLTGKAKQVSGPASQQVSETAKTKKPLAFEVVSIKVNKEGGRQTFGATANGYELKNLFLEIPIMTAYVPRTSTGMYSADQIVGMPFWASDERYDITAKVSDADLADWHDAKMQPAMLREMLQTMLTERMKLAVHRSSKEGNVFELVVGKDGPKFRETNPAEHHAGQFTLPDGGVMSMEPRDGQMVPHLYAATVNDISMLLLNDTGRQIVDKTGLTGKYDVAVQPNPPRAANGQAQDGAAAMDNGPVAFTRANELGLKLVPAKGEIETLVIDHVEKPSEN